MSEIIEVNGLRKSFKDFVLGPIDMEIHKGAVTAVLGSNASGKTTFLKCLGRQYVCDRGYGSYQEENGQLRVGFVYDECPYPGSHTIQRLTKLLSGLYPDWDQRCFSDLCSRFGLEDGRRIEELSKGSKMKLQVAVNLSHKVDLLLLDEFTSGLDDRSKRIVMEAVKVNLDDDNAVVMSTNDTSDLERFADRIVILRDGRVALDTDVPTLQDSFMIVRTTDPNIAIGADDLMKVRKEGYGSVYLVRNSGRMPEAVGNTVVEKASVREVLAFYTEGRVHERCREVARIQQSAFIPLRDDTGANTVIPAHDSGVGPRGQGLPALLLPVDLLPSRGIIIRSDRRIQRCAEQMVLLRRIVS